MPMVRIEMWEGRTDEAKEKLIEEVSKAVAETTGAAIEQVWVVLTEVQKKNWGIGGVPASKL